ncbi:hypothetical protein AB0O34_30635 [Sphaerisporangium sp. NPDC088356]|uniref:hypothetical protein n=1 Tax=Sphaerisporangium sp. NPDC088356 TaxID=3154871 RepID=UPI0034425873
MGCARVVSNDALAVRDQAYTQGLPFVTDAEPSVRVITAAKKRPHRAWLGEVSAVVLQQALADCTAAFRPRRTAAARRIARPPRGWQRARGAAPEAAPW